jgi:hypothetical protein
MLIKNREELKNVTHKREDCLKKQKVGLRIIVERKSVES